MLKNRNFRVRVGFTTSGTYPWSFVTQIFHNGQPSHGGDRKFFEVITSTLPKGTLGSVASLIAATLYQGNIYSLAKLGKCNSNLASTILKQLTKMAR